MDNRNLQAKFQALCDEFEFGTVNLQYHTAYDLDDIIDGSITYSKLYDFIHKYLVCKCKYETAVLVLSMDSLRIIRKLVNNRGEYAWGLCVHNNMTPSILGIPYIVKAEFQGGND